MHFCWLMSRTATRRIKRIRNSLPCPTFCASILFSMHIQYPGTRRLRLYVCRVCVAYTGQHSPATFTENEAAVQQSKSVWNSRNPRISTWARPALRLNLGTVWE